MRSAERVVLVIVSVCVAFLMLRAAPLGSSADARPVMLAGDEPIAVCAIPTLVNELMASDRFLPELERVREEGQAEINALRERLEEIGRRIREAGPEGSEQLIGEYQEILGELRQKSGELEQRVQRLTARQISECYELARSSAIAVAEDLGYEYVIASGSADEELNREIPEVILRQITARPMILAPDAADVTPDVRDDLNLD